MARSLSLAAGALAVLLPAVASATVIVPRTIEEMAQDSVCVVRGTVISSEAAWDDQHQRIFTNTAIDVVDQIHGPAEPLKRITVRTLGGEVGKVGMTVAGTEKFTPNEEVVLFLRKDPVVTSTFQVVGMSQGKYRIERASTGGPVAIPSTEGLAFAKRDETGVYKVDENSAPPDRIPLADLRKRIVEAVHAKANGGAATQVPQGTLRLKPAQANPHADSQAPNQSTQSTP